MSRAARTNKRIITTMTRYARSARWLLAGGLLFAASAAAQSDYIRDVETELQQLGYDVGAINGVFDDTLESAINRFKADEGLPQDGALTRDTRALIAARAAGEPLPSRLPAPTQPTPPTQPVAPPPQPKPSSTQAATPPPAAPPTAAARRGRAAFGESGWRAGRSAYKRRVGFVVDLAAEFGGDDLVTVVLDNNDSEDITAGDGIVLGAGGYWLLRENFGLQGTLAYKIKQTSADNSDLGLERWIVDVSAITFVDDFQFAAGLVHHTNIDFDGDGFLPDFSFDDATGLKLEIGYSWFALSYTNIDYEVNGFSFDASNVGLRLRGGF